MEFYTNFRIYKNDLLIRYIEDGERKQEKIQLAPTLYYIDQNSTEPYRTIHGSPLSSMEFSSVYEARSFLRDQREAQNHAQIHGFPRFEYSAIDKIFPGVDGIDYNFGQVRTLTIDIEIENEQKQGFPDIDRAEERINAITMGFRGQYIALAFNDTIDVDRFYALIHEENPSWSMHYIKSNIRIKQCRDETDLLVNFLRYWQRISPDVVTGWSSEFFDIPYLINRMWGILGSGNVAKLSPWAIVESQDVYKMGSTQQTYDIAGVASLDYLDLYKKFTYTAQESYKLDYIAHAELGRQKLDYSGEHANLHDLYRHDFTKFLAYNVQDVVLVDELDQKKNFLFLIVQIAYMAKVNYEDVFRNVRVWDVLIASYLHNTQNVMVPAIAERGSMASYEGAYVKEPIQGYFDWVASFDLTSLYPSLIMQNNISPDTLHWQEKFNLTPDDVLYNTDKYRTARAYAQENNLVLASNGSMYDKSRRGFLAEMMEKYFNKRQEYKALMKDCKQKVEQIKQARSIREDGEADVPEDHTFHDKTLGELATLLDEYKTKVDQYDSTQDALKIGILNSAYGALGSPYFRMYSQDMAMGITLSGQSAIRWVAMCLNRYMQKQMNDDKDRITGIDTDSVYLDMTDLIPKENSFESESAVVDYIDNRCQGDLQAVIDKAYEKYAEKTMAYETRMDMDREVIGKGIFVQKKRYVIKVFDNEGVRYTDPKMKIMGLEAVRSSTPEYCRNRIKETLRLIFDKTAPELREHIDAIRREFYDQLPLPDIAIPSGVNKMDKWRDSGDMPIKGTPMHVRGALLYNKFIDKYELNGTYEKIGEGDKIKIVHLKTPNPTGSKAISFPTVLPKEFGLDKYVDRKTQFHKTFEKPIERVFDVIGWDIEEKMRLTDFFQ